MSRKKKHRLERCTGLQRKADKATSATDDLGNISDGFDGKAEMMRQIRDGEQQCFPKKLALFPFLAHSRASTHLLAHCV